MTHHIICVYLAFRMMLLVMKCLSPLPGPMTQLLSASPYMVRDQGPCQPGGQHCSVFSRPEQLSLRISHWQLTIQTRRAHNNIQIHIWFVRLQIGPMDHIKREHSVRPVSNIMSPCHSLGMRCLSHISMQDTVRSLNKIFHNYRVSQKTSPFSKQLNYFKIKNWGSFRWGST